MTEHEAAIALLEAFVAELPRSHPDRRGARRAIEVLRHGPSE